MPIVSPPTAATRFTTRPPLGAFATTISPRCGARSASDSRSIITSSPECSVGCMLSAWTRIGSIDVEQRRPRSATSAMGGAIVGSGEDPDPPQRPQRRADGAQAHSWRTVAGGPAACSRAARSARPRRPGSRGRAARPARRARSARRSSGWPSLCSGSVNPRRVGRPRSEREARRPADDVEERARDRADDRRDDDAGGGADRRARSRSPPDDGDRGDQRAVAPPDARLLRDQHRVDAGRRPTPG